MKDEATFGRRKIVLLCLCITSHVCAQQGAYNAYVNSFDKSRPFKETVYHARQALTGALRERNDSLVCLAHIQLGILYWNDGAFADAESHLTQGQKMAEQLHRWRDAAKSIHYRALTCYYRCEFESALALYDTAEQRYRKLGIDSAIAKIKSHKGLIYNAQGNFSAAIQNMIESFRLQEKTPGYRDHSIPMQFPSPASERIYFESKLEKDMESLLFLRNTNDTYKRAFTLQNIGRDYFLLKRYDSAIRYYKASSDTYRQIKHDPFMSHIAETYSAMGKYDSAEYYYLLQLKINQIGGTQIHRANLLRNLGELYRKSGDLKRAKNYIHLAASLNKKLGLQRSFASCLMASADLEVVNGEYQQALNHVEQALDVYRRIGCLRDTYDGLQVKSNVLSHLHRSDDALLALRESVDLRETLASGENQYRVAQLQLEYDSEKKSRDLANLQTQHRLKEAELENKNLILWFAAFAVFFGVILLALLFNRMKQKTRNAELLEQKNKLTEEKNQLLEAQAIQKEVLMHEIHHRVKNNLQIIASLVNLNSQSASMETNEILQQLANRIFSMGLVHEQLYEKENVTAIDLDVYLTKLCEHLQTALTDKRRSIQLKIVCDSIKTPIEIALACGLICNELVTNSIKYAFPPGYTDCRVDVRLTHANGSVVLVIGDNGVGFDQKTEKSFGLKFVEHLTRSKLNGRCEWRNENGSRFRISFSCKAHAAGLEVVPAAVVS